MGFPNILEVFNGEPSDNYQPANFDALMGRLEAGLVDQTELKADGRIKRTYHLDGVSVKYDHSPEYMVISLHGETAMAELARKRINDGTRNLS